MTVLRAAWLFTGLLAAAGLACADDWRPVSAAELSQKEPLVEKDADAEIIFMDVRISDEFASSRQLHVESRYVRTKIFNERGRDHRSTVNVPILKNTQVTSIAGRTIHPDGTIVELKNDAIFDRVLDKARNLRVKSFTLPGVEPGSIIEYRYSEEHEGPYPEYQRLDFQSSIPIQTVRYTVRPSARLSMFSQDFNCPGRTPFEQIAGGYYVTTMSRIPAFKEEPWMPPADQLRAWTLIYYRPLRSSSIAKEQFWREHAKESFNNYSPRLKATRMLQQKAAEVAANAKSDEDKVLALLSFCKRAVKNTQTEAVAAEEREDLKKNRNSEDTLKQGIGNSDDIRFLFAALVNAAGLEARIAELPSRKRIFFNPSMADPYFLIPAGGGSHAVAVKVGDTWRFYDPAATQMPRDMMAWPLEGVTALVTDPKEAVFVTTPISKPEQSMMRRRGAFRLDDDGTLEGDVSLEFTGHEAAALRERAALQSDAAREATFKSLLKHYADTATFTEIQIENLTDAEKPLLYRCHIRVPAYAERTGKRLLFAPGFFQQGAPPRFPLKERKNDVQIPFPWAEEDHVTFEWPAGFEVEEPRVPAPIVMGKLARFEIKASIENKKRLVFDRRFRCGDNGIILLPVRAYPELKEAFDQLARADEQTLSLKQPAAPSN